MAKKGAQMPSDPHLVSIENHGKSLADLMGELRSWLDSNGIAPMDFKHAIMKTGAIEVQMVFQTSDQASLFDQAFGRSAEQQIAAWLRPETYPYTE